MAFDFNSITNKLGEAKVKIEKGIQDAKLDEKFAGAKQSWDKSG